MMLVTRYGADGQPAAWLDLDTRTAHDTASGADLARPLSDRENAAADALVAALADAAQADALREQLAAGVAAIKAARDAAQADIAAAEGLRATATNLRAAATTQRTQVAGFTPASTYSAAQLTAVRDALAAVLDRQAVIIGAMADMYAYRADVDRNAVRTDDALLWLARLASGLLDDPTTP